MALETFNDVLAFIHVVREGSFTRAATKLGNSPSALSHAVRALETRLGVQLLTRTTRRMATTDAGERLFNSVAPQFEEIDAEVAAVREMGDKPAGTVRITSAEHAAATILWPRLAATMQEFPGIAIEISIDYAMVDIVSRRYDAGVRVGDQIAKDMIAVRISPDQRMAVVGSPGYFARNTIPATPDDLIQHNCIRLKLPAPDGFLAWEFGKGRQRRKVIVNGQWVFSNSSSMVRAALADHGLACVPEDMVLDHIAAGRLLRALQDWCQPYPGYYLYYPSRRQPSRAMSIVVEALRLRA